MTQLNLQSMAEGPGAEIAHVQFSSIDNQGVNVFKRRFPHGRMTAPALKLEVKLEVNHVAQVVVSDDSKHVLSQPPVFRAVSAISPRSACRNKTRKE